MDIRIQKSWEEANKNYLTARLELVRQTLKRASGTTTEEDGPVRCRAPYHGARDSRCARNSECAV